MNVVRRYSSAASSIGAVFTTLGLFLKPHPQWLWETGILFSIVSMGATLFVARSMMRKLTATIHRVRRLCDLTGVPFGVGNAVFRWVWPSMFAMLTFAFTFRILAMILGATHTSLRHLSDAFYILSMLGVVLVLTRPRQIENILFKLESTHPGEYPTSPPKVAKLILLLVPKRCRENLIGDLEEEYTTILLPEYGARRARAWYWWQVALSIGPLLWAQVKRGLAVAWVWKRVR